MDIFEIVIGIVIFIVLCTTFFCTCHACKRRRFSQSQQSNQRRPLRSAPVIYWTHPETIHTNILSISGTIEQPKPQITRKISNTSIAPPSYSVLFPERN
jgi:hypothetical protein